jgi:hypothetical protein
MIPPLYDYGQQKQQSTCPYPPLLLLDNLLALEPHTGAYSWEIKNQWKGYMLIIPCVNSIHLKVETP